MNTFEQTVTRWWKFADKRQLGDWHYVKEWCHGAYCATGNEDYLFLSLIAGMRCIMEYEEYYTEIQK